MYWILILAKICSAGIRVSFAVSINVNKNYIEYVTRVSVQSIVIKNMIWYGIKRGNLVLTPSSANDSAFVKNNFCLDPVYCPG
jgi:hypothetical protein